MKKRMTALAVRLGMASVATAIGIQPVFAHDFWLRPETFAPAPADPFEIRMVIGHGTDIQPWRLVPERVVAFRSYGPGGVTDLQPGINYVRDGKPGHGQAAFDVPGTHILSLESYHSHIDLEAEKFNSYVEKEGITPIQAHREKNGTGGKNGTEIYSRRAKALIQVGETYSPEVTRPIGHTLEIVPEHNPYDPDAPDALPVRVLYYGKPLEGALIDLSNLDLGGEPVQAVRTDGEGRAVFRIPRAGAWKLNVIWARPLKNHDRADYETVFTSLTLGY